MDPSGDGVGGLTATGLFRGFCGAQSSPTAKFCSKCGAALAPATRSAEYKQVTVLFADPVHSMDIAAAVGTERLREIMTELVNRAAGVVQRFGGTVNQFTGDGIMAWFGAPTALEGSRFPRLPGGVGHPGGGEAACHRPPTSHSVPLALLLRGAGDRQNCARD